MYNIQDTNNDYDLHRLNSKKNILKYRYKNNPCQSTLFDILNTLKQISTLKIKLQKNN